MNASIKRMIFSILAVLLLLAACVPASSSNQDPALVQKVIEQSVALTVAAQDIQSQSQQVIDQAVAMTVTAQNSQARGQEVFVVQQATTAPTLVPTTTDTGSTPEPASNSTPDDNAPVVRSISPNTGFTTGVVRVVITGENFIPGRGFTHFYFDTAEAAYVDCKSTTECTATAPQIEIVEPAGTSVTVTVTAKNIGEVPGANGAGNTFTYEVLDPAAPVVEKVDPGGGPIAGGSIVTITGRNFEVGERDTQFYFGDNQATEVICESAQKCEAKSPPGKEGIVTVEAVILTSNNVQLTSKHIEGNRTDSFKYYAPLPHGCGIITVTPPTKGLITLSPGDTFTVKFIVKNTGTRAWPAGTDVKYSSGDNMGDISRKEIDKAMRPGDTFTFSFKATAPTSPGIHYMTWIVEGQGCQGGYVAINVD